MSTLPVHIIPYGLRDVKIRPINADGTRGAQVDLPAGRTFSFTESEEFTELRGDDRLITSRGQGGVVEWDLEGGGISFEAYKVINGGEITVEMDTDPTPNEVSKTYTKRVTDVRPFFEVEGQALSDSGGDFHAKVFRCRASDELSGELTDGEFWLTGASGQGFSDPDNDDKLYEFVQNAAVTAITDPV